MFKKIKQWWLGRKIKHSAGTAYALNRPAPVAPPSTYTKEQVERAYQIGYQDGKADGLAYAKHQAQESLRNILKNQNQ